MSDKGKDYWTKQLQEKIKRNPQIRLEQLKDFIRILGRRTVENAWKQRTKRQSRR